MFNFKNKIFLIIASIFFISCNSNESPVKLNIAAAGNMRYAFDTIKTDFNKIHPDIAIRGIFASSGKHYIMIKHGGPFDLFLSADMIKPEKLWKEGYAVDKPVPYAYGRLVLFSTKNLSFTKGLKVLNDKRIKRIAIANKNLAPYGRAAYEVLKKNSITNISSRSITAQNIMQAANYSLLTADAGFLSLSAIHSDLLKNYNIEGKYWILINKNDHKAIEQGMVIIKNSTLRKEAGLFYTYMLSKRAGIILQSFGYGTSNEQF